MVAVDNDDGDDDGDTIAAPRVCIISGCHQHNQSRIVQLLLLLLLLLMMMAM